MQLISKYKKIQFFLRVTDICIKYKDKKVIKIINAFQI